MVILFPREKTMNNTLPVEHVDYEVIDNPNKEKKWACVKILKSPYENVIVEFGKLKFAEKENEDGSLNAEFDHNIIDYAGKKIENENFAHLLGDILIDILSSYLRERDQDEIKPIGDDDLEGTDPQ